MAKVTALVFLLCATLVSCHLHTGEGRQNCNKSDVRVAVERTGKTVGGQAEYRVSLAAPGCPCSVSGVRVWCDGVQDGPEPVDGSLVDFEEGICVLKQPIPAASSLSFTYTSRTPVNFPVLNATADC
uniref:LGC1 n=1 Tax=Leersia perrieri TaxID=77586 RepID=A0A0D9XSB6_9ORYZ